MSDTDTNAEVAATPVAELAAEAALLDARRERLAAVRAGIQEAADGYSAAIVEANRRYSATVGPLDSERTELLAAVARSEEAAAELEARRRSVAELRAELAELQAELAEAEQELPAE